jgi:hypothetical protein
MTEGMEEYIVNCLTDKVGNNLEKVRASKVPNVLEDSYNTHRQKR